MLKRTVMRKYNALFLLSGLSLLAFSLIFSSCKDDDPPAKPKLSFGAATLTVKESDANTEIQVVLDKAASEDITIDYSLKGTAKDKITAGTSAPADYEIVGDYGEVEILEGETTGIITLDLFSDSDLEDDETIEISIDDVSSDEIEITREDEIAITLQQEDGLIVVLEWGVADGENYTDVDMDLFLWAENTSAALVRTGYLGISGTNQTSLIGDTRSPEFFFLPTAAVDDGSLGLSCTYYEGATDPMNFEVSFIEIVNGDDVSTVTKKATYTVANVNKWDEDDAPEPILILKFKKTGTDFLDFEEITVPAEHSRVAHSSDIPSILKSGVPSKLKKETTPLMLSERLRTYFKTLGKN